MLFFRNPHYESNKKVLSNVAEGFLQACLPTSGHVCCFETDTGLWDIFAKVLQSISVEI